MGKSFFNYITQKQYFSDITTMTGNNSICLEDIIDELINSINKDNTIQNLQNEIVTLQQQLADCQSGINYKPIFGMSLAGFDTNVNVQIGEEYIKYILEWGVPEDGYFSPELLATYLE
jgi:hypothetical protein